jgi:hypothetical protein
MIHLYWQQILMVARGLLKVTSRSHHSLILSSVCRTEFLHISGVIYRRACHALRNLMFGMVFLIIKLLGDFSSKFKHKHISTF